MRTYRLSSPRAIRWTAFVIAGLLMLGCGGIFLFHGDGLLGIVMLGSLFLVALLFFDVYEVAVDDEGVCEFRALLRRKRVHVHQIRSIKGGPTDDPEESNDVVIRYEGRPQPCDQDRCHTWLVSMRPRQ
jgi:hypothetical protein